jgi:flagellar protein FliO/FliZ
MQSTGWSLLWFVAVVAMIPVALWLLKRSGRFGAVGGTGVLRTVAAMPLSPNQRVVTIEVGQGDARRWLVLGVTAHTITTLHSMEPQGAAPAETPPAPFAQLISRLQAARGKGDRGAV